MKTGAHSKIPRCGCCDKANPALVCEDCGEPMCTDCHRRIDRAHYVCVICLEESAVEPLPALLARVNAEADQAFREDYGDEWVWSPSESRYVASPVA